MTHMQSGGGTTLHRWQKLGQWQNVRFNKDFKIDTINEQKEIMLRELKEAMTIMSQQIENINKKTNYFFKNMEILGLKSKITEILKLIGGTQQ